MLNGNAKEQWFSTTGLQPCKGPHSVGWNPIKIDHPFMNPCFTYIIYSFFSYDNSYRLKAFFLGSCPVKNVFWLLLIGCLSISAEWYIHIHRLKKEIFSMLSLNYTIYASVMWKLVACSAHTLRTNILDNLRCWPDDARGKVKGSPKS